MAKTSPKRWSQDVTEHSDALDLKKGVFTLDRRCGHRAAARRLLRGAAGQGRARERRKSDPYRSAMSMLNFYINRAGKNLSVADRARLDKAKDELRKLFHRKAAKPAP